MERLYPPRTTDRGIHEAHEGARRNGRQKIHEWTRMDTNERQGKNSLFARPAAPASIRVHSCPFVDLSVGRSFVLLRVLRGFLYRWAFVAMLLAAVPAMAAEVPWAESVRAVHAKFTGRP